MPLARPVRGEFLHQGRLAIPDAADSPTKKPLINRLGVLDLLNQGEAVHSLQRAIHNRMITAKHGRTMEELGTISGALTLLANIVMAWNTHRIQAMIDATPGDHPDEVTRRLAPIGHKHINMRGILTFDLGRHRSSLLRQAPSAVLERVPG